MSEAGRFSTLMEAAIHAECQTIVMAGLYKLMPETLEGTVMFKSDEFSNFEALFDRLSSFATVQRSLQLSKRDLSGGGSRTKKDPDAMDIGAVSKG